MATGNYIDIYLLPVQEDGIDRYRDQATAFGTVVREYGALSYREFLADDLGDNLTAGAGEVLTAAVVEFESREQRDEVMGKAMADPRVKDQGDAEQVANMSQMRYGGFKTFVDV